MDLTLPRGFTDSNREFKLTSGKHSSNSKITLRLRAVRTTSLDFRGHNFIYDRTLLADILVQVASSVRRT